MPTQGEAGGWVMGVLLFSSRLAGFLLSPPTPAIFFIVVALLQTTSWGFSAGLVWLGQEKVTWAEKGFPGQPKDSSRWEHYVRPRLHTSIKPASFGMLILRSLWSNLAVSSPQLAMRNANRFWLGSWLKGKEMLEKSMHWLYYSHKPIFNMWQTQNTVSGPAFKHTVLIKTPWTNCFPLWTCFVFPPIYSWQAFSALNLCLHNIHAISSVFLNRIYGGEEKRVKRVSQYG